MNCTHIAVILDRSGPMAAIRDDVIGGFNAFLAEHRAETGTATLSLIQFDGQETYHAVHDFRDIGKVPELTERTYVLRGSTSLLDAVGQTLAHTEATLFGMEKKQRPGRVIIVVITDGMENASREYTAAQVKKTVEERSSAGWQFVFLSSDLSAVEDASRYGFGGDRTMAFDQDARGAANMFATTSERVREYRSGTMDRIAFSPSDRDLQKNESRRRPRKTNAPDSPPDTRGFKPDVPRYTRVPRLSWRRRF